jgi:hypothetical protein
VRARARCAEGRSVAPRVPRAGVCVGRRGRVCVCVCVCVCRCAVVRLVCVSVCMCVV